MEILLKGKYMSKSSKKKKSIFTDLDTDRKRESQVYVNEEIIDAVIDAKKKASTSNDVSINDSAPVPSTVRKNNPYVDDVPSNPTPMDNNDKAPSTEEDNPPDISEPHPDDLEIYDTLFADTTIVSTQIYTYEIDKNLGEDNYSTGCSYRVGQDISDMGTLFTVTKKELSQPINVSRPHKNGDLKWYNDLAALGYAYAAVCGTKVQGIAICDPQLWNNTLFMRHLMVAKEFRLNGIGRMLIDECMHRAKSEGFRALALEVSSSNGAAIDFYKHLHFNVVGLNIGLYTNSDILKEDVGIFMQRPII